MNNDYAILTLLVKIYSVTGTAYDYSSDYTQSIKFYLKAQSLFGKIGNVEGIGLALNNLDITYLYTQNLDRSESCFKQAYILGKVNWNSLDHI